MSTFMCMARARSPRTCDLYSSPASLVTSAGAIRGGVRPIFIENHYMNIHEYQAKEIFRAHGVPIPPGETARTPDEASAIATRFGGTVVIKAQVHAGGRGKAGGVKLAKTPAEAKEIASKILGMQIKGLTVHTVLVTPAADIVTEAYVGIIVDRVSKKPVFMVSPAGGIDIEEVRREDPRQDFAPSRRFTLWTPWIRSDRARILSL